MFWMILVAFLIGSLLAAGIAYAGLWLGWNARDKVGQSLQEAYVGHVGLTDEKPEPSITQEDFLPSTLEDEDREY